MTQLLRRTSGLSLKKHEIMDRAKKKLASALDGLRSGVHSHKSELLELDERVTAEHVCLATVVRHGFPHDPQCIAFDPVQRLLAIGTGHGSVRILGDSGVDYYLKHESDSPVQHMQFLVNEGGLITACRDDTIHLWNFRQKTPEIVHSVQLQKESKWIHVGTEKGNVYFVSVSTFTVSGYVIMWNKAIDLSSRVHPGGVRCVLACPIDPGRLLIAYEKGAFVLWNLATKETERFPQCEQTVRAIAWHHDGKQFMCGHVDGSITVWQVRKPSDACVQRLQPHGTGPCRPIDQLEWRHNADGEQLIIFSGGMPADDGVLPALTLLRGPGGRSATVLEMDHALIAFTALLTTPWTACPQQPYAVAALLKSDLLVVDLATHGYPCFESPHVMDLHEPPVTVLSYVADCPVDMIGALTLVGCKQRKQPFSERPWPITGGTSRECATGHQELLLTGHEDGSVKFWQASGEHLQLLYRLKTGRHFERQASTAGSAGMSGGADNSQHAVRRMKLCTESRLLLVASAAAQCTLFRFVKCETAQEITVIHFPLLLTTSPTAADSATASHSHNDDQNTVTGSQRELRRQAQAHSIDSHSSDTSEGSVNDDRAVPVKVRGGALRRPAGYQPELVCLVPWMSPGCPERITALGLNSAFGLIAIATTSGLALIDTVHYVLVHAWTLQELHSPEGVIAAVAQPPPPLVTQQSDSSQQAEAPQSAPVHQHDRRRTSTDGGTQSAALSGTAGRKISRASSFVQLIRRSTADIANSAKYRRRQLKRQSISSENGEEAITLNEGAGGDPSPRAGASTVEQSSQGTPSKPNANSHQNSQNSRSPSVSSFSQERDATSVVETVSAITFINSHSRKNDSSSGPCLWLGTSSGACIPLNLTVPGGSDRTVSPVVVAPSGCELRLKGELLYTAFMDASFCVIAAAGESFRDAAAKEAAAANCETPSTNSEMQNVNCEKKPTPTVASFANRVLTKCSLSPSYTNAVENGNASEEITQLLIAVSEEEIRVLALPSFASLFAHRCEEIPLVRARTTHVRGLPVLIALAANGAIVVLSLPSLRSLLNVQLFRFSIDLDDPILDRFALSEHGLAMFMCTPSEVEKLTVCSELARQVAECSGELFLPMDMPEPPKTSFLKGVSTLFSGGGAGGPQRDSIDLDTLFSDQAAGKPSRSVARTIPGPSTSLDTANSKSISAGQAANMALQALHERSDKLNATVDVTENLRNSAMSMQGRAAKLAEKYEKKKWYQL